ncbi:MAG: sugar-binding protein, partial [Planctomycetota bacterium]
MAKSWITLLTALLLGSLQLAAQDIRVAQRSQPPQVDGVLQEGEWPGEALKIDRQEQVWSKEAWGGVKDLSAKIHLNYDPSHLYVAGQVWDDSFRAGQVGVAWHRQDALELFLDPSPDLSAERLEFGSEDLQFFIMPFNPERPWGVMGSREDSSGRTEARPGGEIYTGVRVAYQMHPDASYSFEAVIPFHNLEGFTVGRSVMGFNLALDDFDAGTERYQYMTWNGEGPASGGRLSRMRFVGVPPLSDTAEDSSGLMNWLSSVGPSLLLPLLGLLLSVLLIRFWVHASRRRPALRSIGWGLGVLLFLAGLLLPGWLSDSRIEEFDAEVDAVAGALTQEMDRMEDSALGSYRGATRDQPLMDLLVGGTITGEREFSHRILEGVSGGTLLRPRALGGFQIRPYWVPLVRAQAERFNFRRPLEEGRINLVLARPQPERLSFQSLGSSPVVLELGLREAEEGPIQETRDLEFRGPFYRVNEFTQARMEATFETIAIGDGLRSLSLSSRADSELYLVGMTWVSRDGSREVPLYLGEDSLGGVETGLRGPLPSNAGFVLAPGASREIRIEDADRAEAQKLWLFFHGDHGGRTIRDLDRGDLVCQVELKFAGES